MATKRKLHPNNQPKADQEEEAPESEQAPVARMADSAKAKSKLSLKERFEEVDDIESELQAAKDTVDGLMASRSDKIQAIKDEHGAGPFEYQGRHLTIVSRTSKAGLADDGTLLPERTTFFFKQAGGKLTKVD